MQKEYTPEDIIKLAEAINRNEESFQWLMYNDCKELAAFCDAYVHANEHALKWLTDFKFKTIVHFYNALDGNQEAFDELFKGEDVEWAAVVNAANDNEDALNWLLQHNFKHFALLAKAIRDTDFSVNRGSSLLGGGIGGSLSGGSGDFGGFGGFGGGSFGGGGGGGSW